MLVNIAVFVSGNGSNLESLLNYKFINGTINLVISNNANAYALIRAKKHNISTEVITFDNNFENNVLQILRKHNIDCIVLAGFIKILNSNIIKAYPNKIINIHPSLIPSFCGKGFYGIRIHEEVIRYGVKISGASVHYVNEVVDGGQIILQKAISVCKKDTPQSLQKKILKLEHKLLPKATQILINKTLKEKNGKHK